MGSISPQINLMTPDITPKRASRISRALVIGLVFFILATPISYRVWAHLTVSRLQQEVEILQARNEAVDSALEKRDLMLRMERELQTRTGFVDQVTSRAAHWVLLEEVYRASLEAEVVLADVSMRLQPGAIVVRGGTERLRHLSEFIVILTGSRISSGVVFEVAQKETTLGAYTFEVTIELSGLAKVQE